MTTPITSTDHRGRLILLAALPSLAGIAVLSLSLLGSASPNHTPPPSKLASTAHSRFSLEISPDQGAGIGFPYRAGTKATFHLFLKLPAQMITSEWRRTQERLLASTGSVTTAMPNG